MANGKLTWDNEGEKLYETGVSHGVLFVYDDVQKDYKAGVAWNGLSSISESPEGAEANDIYADNAKYLSLYSAETFGATIEAYMYPEEFEACDGSAAPVAGMTLGQQSRKAFALSYETIVGNDLTGDAYGKKIHIIYGCKVSPSEKSYETVNDSPEAITFSWEVSTTPLPAMEINGVTYKPTATLILDSTKVEGGVTGETWKKIEDYIYGSSTSESKLLKPDVAYRLLTGEAVG